MQQKKQLNYTPELTNKLIELYEQHGTEGIAEIAKGLQRPEKSVIAKLVRLNIYKPIDKPASKRSGMSKKEIINELEEIVQFDVSGLLPAAKPTLQKLLDYLKK